MKSNPYRAVRWRLFAINLGALLAILIVLLSIVYTLMAQQLYNVVDMQLNNTAQHILHDYIHNQDQHRKSTTQITNQSITFSLWHVVMVKKKATAQFIDGDPFINIRKLYASVQQSGKNMYENTSIGGANYRAFTAVINTMQGKYLIYTTRSLASANATLTSLLWTLTASGLAALVMILIVAILLANRSIEPIIRSWQRQQQFVADASHELRTPLSIIKTNLDVLLRNPEHTIANEMTYLANAYEEVTRTASLISDLLTLARADSNEQLIEHIAVNMSQLIEEVVETITPVVDLQKKSITASMPESPCFTLGDRPRLRQLLLILIDNALRYSYEGATISLRLESTTLHTALTVVDTGMGIDPKVLPHVFDRFVRGDRARHRENQGSGLGLSIAKWIVEAHHGSINIESELMKGTKVSVLLPP